MICKHGNEKTPRMFLNSCLCCGMTNMYMGALADIDNCRRCQPGIKVSQKELLKLANMHEPEASSSPPGFRYATCVKCSKNMPSGMWHLWLKEGGFKKEIHLCADCGKDYAR